jgi:hypothetical protein
MVAELYRRVLASLKTALTVLAASLVSGAKTEFGLWPPVRKRLLLQTLGLAHLAPFPYR